jgi:RNA polymerase sigma factor (sigma-70 family)
MRRQSFRPPGTRCEPTPRRSSRQVVASECIGRIAARVILTAPPTACKNGKSGGHAARSWRRTLSDREAADPFDEAEESLRRQGVRRALDALPERERRILELRFGFEGEPWTLEAIGHELDLTRERVRQLEAQALARLAALRDLSSVAAN